jgi:hypothetical protein
LARIWKKSANVMLFLTCCMVVPCGLIRAELSCIGGPCSVCFWSGQFASPSLTSTKAGRKEEGEHQRD